MAACFRELAARSSVDSYFLAFASGRAGSGGGFGDDIVADLPCRLLEPIERNDAGLVREIVREHRPDAIVICGWFHPAYQKLLRTPALADVPIIMTMDTPWWGRPRQWLGRIALRRQLRRIAMMVVTGERSWQYAIRLGIPQEKIRRGMYGVDHRRLTQCLEQRVARGEQRKPKNSVSPISRTESNRGGEQTSEAQQNLLSSHHSPLATRYSPVGSADGSWPRQFLFAGRYAKEKALDVLVDGYQRYRQHAEETGNDPWSLVCCGSGPLASLLNDIPGLENRGFVQPSALPELLTSSGVFVLPSRYDPWPLALVEACATGLPVIASEACGSTVELVRPEYNGYLIPTGNSSALADAMLRAHQEHDRLPLYGVRANQFAAAYSAQIWADRWIRYLEEASGDLATSH